MVQADVCFRGRGVFALHGGTHKQTKEDHNSHHNRLGGVLVCHLLTVLVDRSPFFGSRVRVHPIHPFLLPPVPAPPPPPPTPSPGEIQLCNLGTSFCCFIFILKGPAPKLLPDQPPTQSWLTAKQRPTRVESDCIVYCLNNVQQYFID